MNCKNCYSIISESFCAQCGYPAKLKRIDRHYLFHEVQHLLHVEKGFLYNIKELFIRPGQSIKEYITDNRSRHMKPVPFLVFASLLYTLVAHYFHVEEAVTKTYISHDHVNTAAFERTSVFTIINWLQHNYGYANIIAGVIVALWVKLFFRKYDYNIFEINILLCFIVGESMLLIAAGALLAGITKYIVAYQLMGYAVLLYITWALGQFFDGKKPASYIKGFLAYTLGFVSFIFLAMVTGIGVDMIRLLMHKN